MSDAIKFRGLEDAPVLNTRQGRFPSGPRPEGDGPDTLTPDGLAAASRESRWKLNIRKFSQDQVLAEVDRRVNDLRARIEYLPVPESDNFHLVRTAASPRPQAIQFTADSEATAPTIHSLEVQWPSRGGLVLSSPQNPIDPVTAADGAHTFTLTIDGVEHTLSVNVNNGGDPDMWEALRGETTGAVDTQEELLSRMAIAISGVDPDIAAEVVRYEQDAYDPTPRSTARERVARLKVYSTAEGAGPAFTLADDAGTLVSDYGLNTGQPPRPARVRVGGVLLDQDGDLVSLDNGHVTGEARDNTRGMIDVPVTAGAGPITQALDGLITKYNELVNYLDRHAEYLRPSLKDRVIRTTESLSADLRRVGLKPTLSGRLGLGAGFAEELAGDFGRFREVLLGENGWVSGLETKLDQISRTGVGSFAADLGDTRPMTDRRRAWALLEIITRGIVDIYS